MSAGQTQREAEKKKAALPREQAERELAANCPSLDDEPQLARNLYGFATAVFIARGQHNDALSALELSIEIYRRHLAEGAAELSRELADSLIAAAICLLRLERRQEALEAVDEAIAIKTALTEHDPETFQPQLTVDMELRRQIMAGGD